MTNSPAAAIDSHEYRQRLARLRTRMAEEGLDALVAYANKTHPGHVRYLTGYEPRLGIHDSAACAITSRDCVLVSNASFDDPASQTWLEKAVVTSDYSAALAEVVGGARRIGIAGLAALPAPVYLGLSRRLIGVELVDAADAVMALRQIKSPAELALLAHTAWITDEGGRAFFECAWAGESERDVLVEVERAMKLAGSDEVSFSTQVSSGKRTARVVAFATDELIEEGQVVQLDCGAVCQGYRGDLSRVVVPGDAHPRLRHFFDVTVEMYVRCLERLWPGESCADVARLAHQIAQGYGLEDCLYRSPNHESGFVGHGIGCSYSEPPEICPTSDTILAENMVIVLEPILSDPELGGIKLEDPIWITSDGPQRLSNLPLAIGAEFGSRPSKAGRQFFTIGYGGRKPDELLERLLEAGVRTVVDVRLRPDRASMGSFVRAKSPDKGIEAHLDKVHIEYRWLVELGNIFLGCDDWPDRYARLIGQSGDLLVERLVDIRGPICLMCAERHVEECHRRQIAELLIRRGWTCRHL